MTETLLRAVGVLAVLGAGAVAQSGWWQLANTGPQGRSNHAMVYDSQRGNTVLFGGFGSGGVRGDTWTWDGITWTQAAATGPAAREGHAMAYDGQRGRTVLFGGMQGSSFSGDTWEWDGSSWTQQATSGPAARADHAMAYDSRRGRTVLFGGYFTFQGPNPHTVFFGDTWEWDGGAWALVAITGPPIDGPMAFDSRRGRTVLYGILGETWEWDGSTWAQMATAGPQDRNSAAMAYDTRRCRTVLFGGQSPSLFLCDTWEWDGSTWTQVAATGPAPRGDHAIAYDSARGRTVLFGGISVFPVIVFADTWEWAAPGTATSYGTGCGNPPLTLSAVATAPPAINSTAQASLADIPSSLAFLAIGWSDTAFGPFALPLQLAAYGMPGCELLQSAEAASLPVTPAGPGAGLFSVPLPNWSVLLGMHIYLQGWAPAPGANASGVIVSNGLDWLIGS